jgi:hypothetical protein
MLGIEGFLSVLKFLNLHALLRGKLGEVLVLAKWWSDVLNVRSLKLGYLTSVNVRLVLLSRVSLILIYFAWGKRISERIIKSRFGNWFWLLSWLISFSLDLNVTEHDSISKTHVRRNHYTFLVRPCNASMVKHLLFPNFWVNWTIHSLFFTQWWIVGFKIWFSSFWYPFWRATDCKRSKNLWSRLPKFACMFESWEWFLWELLNVWKNSLPFFFFLRPFCYIKWSLYILQPF